MNLAERGKKMSELVAKCWADDGFKQKLLADPAATLKAEGVALPDGLSVRAVENTDKVVHLVIPAKPTELSDEDMDKVAAGASLNVLGIYHDTGPEVRLTFLEGDPDRPVITGGMDNAQQTVPYAQGRRSKAR